jgi:hypothetical protein
MSPEVKLTTVDVETPYVCVVNGKVDLLLNVVQSEDDRQPAREPLAVAQVSDDANEPMTEIGCESDRAPEAVRDVVATLPNVLTPVKYGMLPTTAAVEVESPLKPIVVPESVIGHVVPIVACLLLNVAQSADERSPSDSDDAVGMFSVWIEPDEEKPKPPLVDDVANVWTGAVRPLSE